MEYTYIIVDDDSKSVLKIRSLMDCFSNFTLVATASNYESALDTILEFQPDFVFLEIAPVVKSSNLSLLLINELHRFLTKVPKVIAISQNESAAIQAVKFDVLDFLIKPFTATDVRKTLLRYQKNTEASVISLNPIPRKVVENDEEESISEIPVFEIQPESTIQEGNHSVESNCTITDGFDAIVNEISDLKNTLLQVVRENTSTTTFDSEELVSQITATVKEYSKNETVDLSPVLSEIQLLGSTGMGRSEKQDAERELICIKSYGDYRFLELNSIAFLQADNNSTDITLHNGEQITAFKTLKYFEENLPSKFYRIHNSYIVNKNFISRIHTGNSVCYIKNTKHQLPFSKSYKENVEQIIALLAGTDFKEI
jgi:DNA-binding LytR/AlgR family response regulator